MRFLITGGAGFIGSNIAKRLSTDPQNYVIVLDDFSTGHFKNLVGFNGDVISDSVTSRSWWEKVDKVDVIFHQAAITDTTIEDQRRMLEVNVEGFRNVVEFAVKFGVNRIIYASSASVYGNGPSPMREDQMPQPQNVYAFSKSIMDNLALWYAKKYPRMRIIGLRYFNVYGPGEFNKGRSASMIYQLYLQMRSGKKPRIFKYGEQMRDFVYIKDVVSANIMAIDCDTSGIYNVGSGTAENFNYVVECINRALGTSYEPEYFDNPYDFYQNKTQADLRRSKAMLNYRPQWNLEDGIKDYINHLEGK